MSKLSDKQKRFCDEYLIDLNATQAYIRAGYKPKGAKENASRLITNDNAQAYIAEKQAELSDKTSITIEYVLNGIKDIAEQGEAENNRLKAFDMLMKHLGGYEKDDAQQNPQQSIIEVTVREA